MKRASPAVARRYARALLDVALQQGTADRLREELRDAQQLLRGQRELLEVLAHPALANDRKKGLLKAVFSQSASPLLLRLLELLLERRRIGLLPTISEAYDVLWNAQRGVAAAHVVSAQPLAASERQALEQALEQATGLGIGLEASEDPSLLGGLLVRIAGRTYDGSLRAQLRALHARLTGGAPV